MYIYVTVLCTISPFYSCRENLSRGQREKGGFWCGAGSRPATSLLPAASAQRSPSASQRMSQLQLSREEDPHLSSMTTLSSMNTVYATGSLSSNRTPTPKPLQPPACTTTITSFTGTLLIFYVLSHPFLSLIPLFFFYRLNQERCSLSIANWLKHWTFITWQLGVCWVEMHEKRSALGRGMWAHPRGHERDPTLYQSRRWQQLYARFAEETVKKLDKRFRHTHVSSCLYQCIGVWGV